MGRVDLLIYWGVSDEALKRLAPSEVGAVSDYVRFLESLIAVANDSLLHMPQTVSENVFDVVPQLALSTKFHCF